MDWPMHRRVERRAIRMHEMLDRLDVDPVALVRLRNGDAYAGARSLCLSCGTSDKCLRWLDGYGRQASRLYSRLSGLSGPITGLTRMGRP